MNLNPKIAGDMIVLSALDCKTWSGCIHGQKQKHEDDLCYEDIIRVAPRPAVKVLADKTF
jgi:hypothetical protein